MQVLTGTNLKLFFISLVAVMLMVSLPKLGVKLPKNSPLMSYPPYQTIEQVKNKIQQITPTNFQLKNPNSLIPTAHADGDFDRATAYILIDLNNGQILASKNPGQSLPIASLTKIMTAIVSLDILDPNELVTISNSASTAIPTKIGLIPEQQLTVQELIAATLITSANDASQALQDHIDQKYTQPIFIESMNLKAQALGLTHTQFSNNQGFDNPDNYSSASDLAILSQYALKTYPLISHLAQESAYILPDNNYHTGYYLQNWNGLIGTYPDTIGLKTGNTELAQHTTIVISNRHQHPLMAIVLGAPNILSRDLWASELLDLGYQLTDNLPPIKLQTNQLKTKYATWNQQTQSVKKAVI